jgi:O-antigen/teichoic acid export membrane protein
MTFPEKTEAMEQHPSMLKKVLRGFSVSVALKMGRLLINLVLMSFLARHIGREGFGLLSATMALVAVLLCLVELGCQEILQRDLVHGDQDPLTLGSVFFTRLAVGVLCYVALLAYASTTQLEKRALLLIYGSLLMTHAATVVIGWLLARHHVSSVAWAQFWGFLVSAAAIAAGLVARAPLWYFAVTYVVECWAVILITIAMFRRYGGRFRRWEWSGARTSDLLRESWFELASQLALLLLFRLDTIMVQELRGAAEAGIYGAAVKVSEVVYFIPGTLGSACLSALVTLQKRDPHRYQGRAAEYFALTLVLAVVCATALVVAAPPIITILFGKDFAESASILTIHAWAFIPFAIGTARTVYFTAEGRLWLNLPSVVTAVLLNAFLNWWWIPNHGGIGAAWATLIAYTAAWILSSFVLPSARDVPRLTWAGLKRLPALANSSLEILRARAPSPAGRD